MSPHYKGGSMPLLLIIGLLVIVVLYVMSTYNTFQTLQTRIEASIQEIGNQLKRQASLIPNLEASVKGYMKHEKDIFTMLTDARKSIDKASMSNAKSLDDVETKIGNLASRLQVIVESNPELKSDSAVNNLMNELRDTADKLMYSRRAVIDLSQQYNQMLVTIPSNFIANWFGFKKQAGIATAMTGSHVEVSDDEMKDVKVNL
jgi:LemA protein